jgi:dUTPase
MSDMDIHDWFCIGDNCECYKLSSHSNIMNEECKIIPVQMKTKQAKQSKQSIEVVTLMAEGVNKDVHLERHRAKLTRVGWDCGIDLIPSAIRNSYPLNQIETAIIINTGFTLVFPPNCLGLVMPRSSSLQRLAGGQIVMGIIDLHYTGDLILAVRCYSETIDVVLSALNQCISDKTPIAQIIPVHFLYPMFIPFDPLALSGGRKDAGYGSTDDLKPVDNKIG